MLLVGGIFVAAALLGWAVMVMNGHELTQFQLDAWRPVTLVGKFVRWTIMRLQAKAHTAIHLVSMLVILAGFGGLITEVSPWFFLLPAILVVVEFMEISREFKVMRTVK